MRGTAELDSSTGCAMVQASMMQIQVHTDHNIHGSEKLADLVRAMVEATLSRHADRITRVEIHLADENGAKPGQDDKRCMMEARLAGRHPTAVTHHAGTVELAVEGAAEKLMRSLDHTLARLDDAR
jgi:hypothetical protein